jgi:hypothetical protein
MNREPLADFQDRLFNLLSIGCVNHDNVLKRDYDRLRNDPWVRMAEKISPCNLVIRHYCLLDSIERSPLHFTTILRQLKLLTYYTPSAAFLLYAEGYSYWRYIKEFLKLYYSKFPNVSIIPEFISLIDRGFQATAYGSGGALWPAPFGDLRYEPLESALQDRTKMYSVITVCPVNKSNLSYFVKSMPIKLNGHIPVKDSHVDIVQGGPQPFTWYTGYKEKYPTAWDRVANTCDVRRIASLFRG